MKFNLVDSYRRNVRLNYPHPSKANVSVPVEFEAEFKNLSREEMAELTRLANSDDASEKRSLLDEVLIGIRSKGGDPAKDENDEPLAPESAADRVKRDVWMTNAVLQDWLASITAGVKAKN